MLANCSTICHVTAFVKCVSMQKMFLNRLHLKAEKYKIYNNCRNLLILLYLIK